LTETAPPSGISRVRGFIGRRVRSVRRALSGPAAEEPLVAGRLPLPSHLVALDSPEGTALLDAVGPGWDYHRLADHYVPQRSPRFCGPATIAILLNALHAHGGLPLRRFDQDTVFTARTEAVKPKDAVVRGGMGLAVFVGYLEAHDLRVDRRFAADTSLDAFRDAAAPLLSGPEAVVAVNYHRPTLGQEGKGHISPLGAYHAPSDRFLVLDVSRHRYPPVWVEARDLFAAMNTVAGTHTRGFVTARL
jgi:hypothetical protein